MWLQRLPCLSHCLCSSSESWLSVLHTKTGILVSNFNFVLHCKLHSYFATNSGIIVTTLEYYCIQTCILATQVNSYILARLLSPYSSPHPFIVLRLWCASSHGFCCALKRNREFMVRLAGMQRRWRHQPAKHKEQWRLHSNHQNPQDIQGGHPWLMRKWPGG